MSAEPFIYLDSSALVKLAVDEPESIALCEHLADVPSVVSSALARAEVPRAVRRHGADAVRNAGEVIAHLDLLPIDDAQLDAAGALDGGLRSLDAIHVAAALTLGDDLGELITYDQRMTDAATAHGIAVRAPR